MPESTTCLNARGALQEIKTLKEAFDDAYNLTNVSSQEADGLRARTLGSSLEGKIDALKESMWLEEVERIFHLREQYDSQITLLKKMGVLETDELGEVVGGERQIHFIVGSDLKQYPLPSFKGIAKGMMEKKELLRIKAEQGFVKLLLVPFAVHVNVLIKELDVYLETYKYEQDGKLPSQNSTHVRNHLVRLGDLEQKLLYGPGALLKEGGRGGAVKKQILDDQNAHIDWSRGWQCLLVQATPDGKGIGQIPQAGQGIIRGKKNPRRDIEAGKSSAEYVLDMVRSNEDMNPSYYGEVGMTVESWIVASMTHLQETGQLMDCWNKGAGCFAHLTGAYVSEHDSFCGACWDGNGYKAGFTAGSSGDKDSASGVRMAVRI